MLAPALADALRAQRDSFNVRFTAARRRWPHLDPNDFSLFLRDQLSPVISAVAAASPDRSSAVAQAGYDLGLQLVAEKLAGPSARETTLNSLWNSTFPAIASLVASDPRRLLASLTNATHQLASATDTRLDDWHRKLTEFGPRCADANQLLSLTQFLAWRSGLAHYRTSALHAATSLPPTLALAAVDAPSSANWSDIHAAYLANPWHTYASPSTTSATQPPLRRVGAFRGFSGLFLTPPLVTTCGEHLLVRSGDVGWLLIADAFGATFHRASPAELAVATTPRVAVSNNAFPDFPAGHIVSSSAVVGSTVALTSARSHSVWVGPAPAPSR